MTWDRGNAVVAGAVAILLVALAGILIWAGRPSSSDAVFSPAGSLAAARYGHSSIRLADGRVLVVGGALPGDTGVIPLATAELWSPATQTFSATGSLTAPRGTELATLLPDGRVLLIGSGLAEGSSAAEVWEPVNGTFSATGPPTLSGAFMATLLPGGRVFVIGSGSFGSIAATAEIWDPATGAFTPSAAVGRARGGASATRLTDGRILVAGGLYVSFANPEQPSIDVLAISELWDPLAGTQVASDELGHKRTGHTATLLDDGRVLIVGGNDFGPDGERALASAELYDPATGVFADTGMLGEARWAHTATLLPDGRVLVIGGQGEREPLSSAETWDPATGTFSKAGDMCAARYLHTATDLPDGRVLVIGGSSTDAPLASAEIWSPRSAAGACPVRTPASSIGQPADDGARIVKIATVDARTRDLTIESPSVGVVRVRLLLPAQFEAQPETRWPALYLLHGAGGDWRSWTSESDVADLTAPTDLLVVMPDANVRDISGWYTDWYNGGAGGPPAWETFHLTELRQLLERNWQAGDRRAVAGLSMGGYGAMTYAARNPGLFLAAASYSGVMDIIGSGFEAPPERWGDPVAQADVWRQHNPLSLAPALRGLTLYVSYGNGEPGPLDPPGAVRDDLEASLATQNDAFVAQLEALGIPATVDAYGPGTHTPPYWERALHRSLPLLLQALGEGGS